MEKDKRSKILKATGLVVLTVLIVVSIFLSIYFVNKNNPNDKEAVNTFVGNANATDFGAFTVTGRELKKSINGQVPKEGNVFFVISMDVVARDKNMTIKKSQFNFSGYKAKKIDGYFYKDMKLKAGEKSSIKIVYEVPVSNREMFLYCYGYRVKMGNSIEYVPIG